MSSGSVQALMVEPGADSVWPYTDTMPVMFISSGCAARFMSSGGQPAPAMMPVRMWLKSVLR